MKFDLRTARLDRGETLASIAAATGVSRQTLMRMERHGSNPLAPTAKRLADHFGVPVTVVTGDEPWERHPLEPAA
jgi:transcriptional regulator with XRE-family HTH domain